MEEVNNMKSVKKPAAEYLSTVNPNAENMDAEKSDVFHTTISKLLFICKRERPEIQPKVTSLCTRVKLSDEEYF